MKRLALVFLVFICLSAVPPATALAHGAQQQKQQQQQQSPPTIREEVRPGASGAATRRKPGQTDDEAAAEAFAETLNDALRKPEAGETRAQGLLTRIECGPKGLVFVFKTGDKPPRFLRLSAAAFDGLHIIAYTKEAGTQLTCGARKAASPTVVTYRASADERAKTDGALIAMEFVPANFKLKQGGKQ